MTEPATPSSPFWQFSLRFYRRQDVADACLRLQDEAGIDVNVLLFLLWLATVGRTLKDDDVATIEARVAPWREQVVKPLRGVRRILKEPSPVIAAAAAEAYRGKVKAIELEAERLQQEALYALMPSLSLAASGSPPSPEAAARANVAAYQAISPQPFPANAVAMLIAALTGQSEER